MRCFCLILLLGCCLAVEPLLAQGPHYDVRSYGATGDTNTLATAAIQQAIDAAHAAGGGMVWVPAGDYLCGTIRLRSHVSLYLDAGATIWASRREADYQGQGAVLRQYVLISADSAEQIALLGRGRIHGQARRSYEPLQGVDPFIADYTERARQAGVEMKMYYKLPPIVSTIHFTRCRDVLIEGISVIEAVFWLMDLKWCERVRIRGVYLESSLEAGVNADGIDIDGCRDVVISDCIVYTGDDAIVLKANYSGTQQYDTENVTVTNCIVSSTSTGLKIGTESYGDFRHITFSNCVVRNSNRGLSIVVRDGGTVEDVLFSDITVETDRKHFNWWGNGDAIWVVLLKRRPNSQLGQIRDVVFRNIVARGQGTSRVEGYAPDSLHPDGRWLENIRFEDVQLTMLPEDYPDKRADHAFAAHHIRGLVLEDMTVSWDALQPEAAWRSALHLAAVEDVEVEGLRGKQAPGQAAAPVIDLRDVRGAWLHHLMPAPGAGTLLRVAGSESASIFVQCADPQRQAARLLFRAPETPRRAIRLEK
ncbi:MAG: hypothetical protein OHK0039_07830 [Bacteroidia bacterium]